MKFEILIKTMKIWLATRFIITIAALLAATQTAHSQRELSAKEYGDWTVTCEDTQTTIKNCAMWQVASTANDAPPLLHVELNFQRPFSIADLLIVVPLGISLTNAPTLYIDQNKVMSFMVDYCIADGCYIRAKLKPKLLEQLLRMQNAVLRLKTFDDQDIELPISGTGSRAAFNSTDGNTNDVNPKDDS